MCQMYIAQYLSYTKHSRDISCYCYLSEASDHSQLSLAKPILRRKANSYCLIGSVLEGLPEWSVVKTLSRFDP